MLKVAVIGMGDISKVHIPIIKAMPFAQLAALCDIKAEHSQDEKDIPFFESVQELLEQIKPDVVHICLPHYLHFEVAQLAARHGAHVFCEKPLALNFEQAQQFASLESEYPNLHFSVCLQNRYNKTVAQLLEIIRSNNFGAVKSVKAVVAWSRGAEYFKAAPWRGKMSEAGGGAMINQSIHTLDLMQLFAGEIKDISAQTSKLTDYDIEVEDTASALINFKSGAKGMYFATIANAKNTNVEIEVDLENASYIIRDNSLFKQDEAGKTLICEDEKLAGTKFYYGASHQTAITAFYRGIIDNTNNYIKASEGVMSLKIIDAINKSSKAQAPINF